MKRTSFINLELNMFLIVCSFINICFRLRIWSYQTASSKIYHSHIHIIVTSALITVINLRVAVTFSVANISRLHFSDCDWVCQLQLCDIDLVQKPRECWWQFYVSLHSYECIISHSAVIGVNINIHQAGGNIWVKFSEPVATFVCVVILVKNRGYLQ
jgi:hypothetical protein